MKRAALALVLAACSTSSSSDFPPRPGGGGTGVIVGGGGTTTTGDAGTGDGDLGDAGVLVNARICIVKDLRTPAVCDTTKDASAVKVTLGTRTPVSPPAKTGEFTIVAQLSTDLVWHASGTTFVTSVMPFGTDITIPIVPDTLYLEMLSSNHAMLLPEGQGSVLARVVNGVSPVANVSATSTLVSGNIIPLYDPDPNARDGSIWREIGPTLGNGAIWFPGVNTITSAQITFTPQGGVAVSTSVNVEDQAITFVTQSVP